MMELVLNRTYFPNGTNGEIFRNDQLICESIELPWQENKKVVSCIPEGRYEIEARFSDQHGAHFCLKDVSNRNLILIHPANNALKELKGCIAPVTKLIGQGIGKNSRLAMNKLRLLVYEGFSKKEQVFITIKKA